MRTIQTDVLVIGAGLGGICAAVSAARNGCSVVLVEKYVTLGGNSSPDAGVHPSGAHRFHTFAAETGIIEEICEKASFRRAKTNTDWYHYNISPQWDDTLRAILQEAGVTVLRSHYARKPLLDGRRISAVIVEDTGAYQTKKIEVSTAVIDASGDGSIAAQAGAAFRQGREAKAEYGERLAPDQADGITMGSSVVALIRETGAPVSFVPPKGTPPFSPGYMETPDFSDEGGTDTLQFFFPAETGGERDTIADEAAIYDTCVSQVYAAWNHIKNISHVEEARNWELLWIGPRLCKRESRRFIGDYVLTQNDVEAGRIFDDAIAFGGFAEDIHYPRPGKEKYVKIVYFGIPPIYTIPYRSIYARDVDNLLFASRLLSVSHIAHGTTRLQRTLAAVGQAAGLAAAFCKAHTCSPRGVYEGHLAEFRQALLRQDGSVPGLVNADEADLARQAAVFATSERPFRPDQADKWLPLSAPSGVMLWDWPKKIETVSFLLHNPTDRPMPVSLSAGFRGYPQKWKTHDHPKKPVFPYEKTSNEVEWGYDNRVSLFAPLGTAQATLPPGQHTVAFALDLSLPEKDACADEERLALTLFADGAEMAVDTRFFDPARLIVQAGEAYAADAGCPVLSLTPELPYAEGRQVINGVNRRFSYNPVHFWESDGPLPQAVTLMWERPQTVGFVQLTFDTLERTFHEMPFDSRKPVSPRLAKAYRIEAKVDGVWQCVAKEEENCHRYQTYAFPAVLAEALRLVVTETWGGGPARVYEVRAYAKKPVIGA